jgi:lysophospholipase L1-like esterase
MPHNQPIRTPLYTGYTAIQSALQGRNLPFFVGRSQNMRESLQMVPSFMLLFSILFAVATAIAGCSSSTAQEVEKTVPKHASTLIAERGETSWDLVALGDSTPAGVGVGVDHSYVQVYAGYIEEDLGVTVDVHNYATGSLRTVANWVQEVSRNENLRNDLQDAEIITLWLGSHDIIGAVGINNGPCYQRAGEVDLDCLRETTDRMQEGYDKLLSEIVELASPAETLILISEIGIAPPWVRKWQEDGSFDLLKRHAYEAWRGHIIHAADKYRVHVVPTYEVLNGPNGDQAISQEYLQSDRVHLNEQGHRLMADIHRSVGYEYSTP